MKILFWICTIVTVIGGINWGMVGFFNFDLVAYLFGNMTVITRIIYTFVGIAAIALILISVGRCIHCEPVPYVKK